MKLSNFNQTKRRVPKTVFCTNCGGMQPTHVKDLPTIVANCKLCASTRIQPLPWTELGIEQ